MIPAKNQDQLDWDSNQLTIGRAGLVKFICLQLVYTENEHEQDQGKYHHYFPLIYARVRTLLILIVYTTQVNSTFRAR